MKNQYTAAGLELARSKFRQQEDRVRQAGRDAGEEAGANCDWHDNFGYEDAKRRLELESQLLQKMAQELSNAQIVEIRDGSDRVAIGTTVKVSLSGAEKEYTIGAHGETDPGEGLISYSSPLGGLLVGMKIGDYKVGKVGGKEVEIEVIEILGAQYKYNRLIKEFLTKNAKADGT